MSDVFLSYASEDRKRAGELATALGRRGWSVWWGRKITAGQAFDHAIERELEAARAVVVLGSVHSIESEWEKNEAAVAAERGVLVPAMIDSVKLPLDGARLGVRPPQRTGLPRDPAARRSTRALAILFAWVTCMAAAQASERCGDVVVLDTQERHTLRYTFAPPPGAQASGVVTLVLLAGGAGHVDLDAQGCAQKLKGNSLVRSAPLFNAAGFATAVVDAPSDFQGEDGLGGFRTDPRHAKELGLVIADLRTRTRGAVWVVGTSRGAISAANAASRLAGPAAPDGVVLTSALMAGQSGARKPWVAQSVFDLPLEKIRVPLLLVGHAGDTCVRSPARLMDRVATGTRSPRQQVVTVSGGPPGPAPTGLDACEGRTPHGFVGQDTEVAAGIARFVRGSTY